MWGAVIAAVAGIISMIISTQANKDSNMGLAQFQANANENYLAQQNQYNSPSAQMDRFKQAGLNPHLIYGQGSPGNQSSPLTFPGINPVDHTKIADKVSDSFPQIQQARLVDSQINAQNAQTRQRYAQTELTKLQAQVVANNPLLDDAGYKATIDGLKAAAELKQEQVTSEKNSIQKFQAISGHEVAKVFAEVKLLDQRFKLSEQDQKIKAEVLKSKEFQNAILEVQKKFMTDGDITPQHILQFVQLLLMKSL